MKQFIRYFLIMSFLCFIPAFVFADVETTTETDTNSATIRIIKRVLPGAKTNGTFTFTILEEGGTEEEKITRSITVHDATDQTEDKGKIGETTIEGLKQNTKYIITEDNLDGFEFVSLESDGRTIVNSNSITITTTPKETNEGEIQTFDVTSTSVYINDTSIANDKVVTSNHDGTHKLSLSVTGSASTSITRTRANILVVYDISDSMNVQDDKTLSPYIEPEGGPKDNDQAYGYNAETGEYFSIAFRTKKACPITQSTNGCWKYGRYGDGDEYVGDKYVKEYKNKSTHAEKTVYTFAHNLFHESNNNVNMALVTFNDSAFITQDWTDDEQTFTNHFSDKLKDNENKLTYSGFTDWKEALVKANDVLDTLTDSDKENPTYVVFITDGYPTSCKNCSYDLDGDKITDEIISNKDDTYKNYYGSLIEVKQIRPKVTTMFGIYAYGLSKDYLDDVIYYANEGSVRSNARAETDYVTNYYNAVSARELNDAINNIFNVIINTAGFSGVSMSDGTTSQVKASTGEMTSLLSVDNTTFEYWLEMPVTPNKDDNGEFDGTYTLVRKETGEPINMILTPNETNNEVSWKDHEDVVLTGSIENNIFKYKWTEANEFYNYNPNDAILNNGAVDWDLKNVNELLDGVTYTVTFDVWPTQYTEDLIADLMNNKNKYETLDENIKDYIIKTDEGYSLRTNTKALITYTDTRKPEEGEKTTTFNSKPNIEGQTQVVQVEKDWPNELPDDKKSDDSYSQLDLYLTKNERNYEKVTLTRNNGWVNTIYIAPGIMKDNTNGITVLETGNDYSFVEDKIYDNENKVTSGYHWDFKVDTVRPMIINGTPKMLIKVLDNSKLEELSENNLSEENTALLDTIGLTKADILALNTNKVLRKDSKTYYKICYTVIINNTKQEKCDGIYKLGTAEMKILLTNARRSNLNITKTLSDGAPIDKNFYFEITVNASDGEDIYFSINDATVINNDVKINNVSVVAQSDNYFRAPSGSKITLYLQKDWNLRFINLPIGSTYTIKELLNSSTPAGFIFQNITLTEAHKKDDEVEIIDITEDDNISTIVKNIINGKIIESGYAYTAKYLNKYESTEVTVTKEWINTNAENMNADLLAIINSSKSATVNLLDENNNIIATETLTVNNTIKDENNENIWKYIWSGLPKCRYNSQDNCDDITYSVREIKVNNLSLSSDGKFYINDDSIHAVIGAWVPSVNGLNITNTWEPKQTMTINLIKKAFGTNNLLPGAKFALYKYIGDKNTDSLYKENIDLDNHSAEYLEYLNNNWILISDNIISDKNGLIIAANLYEGEYRLVEVIPPAGYILPRGQWRVLVNPEDDVKPIEYIGLNNPPVIDKYNNIYNEQIPTMPSTGGLGIYEICLIGLFLMLLGVIALAYDQREQIKNI